MPRRRFKKKKKKEKALTLAINSAEEHGNTPDESCVQGRAGVAGLLLCGIHINGCTISVLQDVFPID